jgi:hypothetical protein
MKLPKKFKKRMDWILKEVLQHNIFLTNKTLLFLLYIKNYKEIVHFLVSNPENEWCVLDIEVV